MRNTHFRRNECVAISSQPITLHEIRFCGINELLYKCESFNDPDVAVADGADARLRYDGQFARRST